jgi:glycosyltransferase involved in cell wall biosynthesis
VKTINVLHLRDTYEIGGPGKTILETHRAIDTSRFCLHLGVFLRHAESSDTPFVRAARQAGMPVHEIRGANQYDPRMVSRIWDVIEAHDIDIIHAHEVKSDVIAWLVRRGRRVPIVTTLHGWISNGTKSRILIDIDKRIVRSFDRVIAVSQLIGTEMATRGVSPKQLRLVHNAIVIERYRRSGRTGYLAELVGHQLSGTVIASIGRLSSEKGHADLVEALALAAARGWRPNLVLAGDGPARADLEGKVRALGLAGAVHFTGYVNQPERLLEETALMVLPSHTEGLPNAALEALAMQVPVLATRVGGTPEVVIDGETGRLVPPRSPQALADAIIDFLTDPAPWRDLADNGRRMVERRFDFKARTRRIEAIYSELLTEQKR